MEEIDLARELAVEVIYVDDHLIELAAMISAGHWRGRATAYTTFADVTEFAEVLRHFVEGGPPAVFQVGAETGIGMIGLRFDRINRAGHIACHARLALGGLPDEHRPEQVSRLSVEFEAEAWAVERFALQLAELANTQAGRAVLAINP